MRCRRIALALAPLVLLATACGREEQRPADEANRARTPASPPAPQVVTITTSDFTFEAPREVPAGLTTFKLVNQGKELHHLQLVRLGEGKTVDDFMAALKAGGPPPAWATMAGGPNPPDPAGRSTATLPLEAGNYVMVCFIPSPDGVPHVAKGMYRPLTVTPADNPGAAEPSADAVMTLVDYGFELDRPLTAGRHTIRIENAGPQPHEVAIVKMEGGKKPIDFAHWGEKQSGPAPGSLQGGVSAIMPGTHAFIEVDLQPGEYGLICFIPDTKDGKAHFEHGMIRTIRVESEKA
jgi:uncharacterized cupredoxin-like copper-binding protein